MREKEEANRAKLLREQELARKAIAGLLSDLQKCGEEFGEAVCVTSLRRFSLESQLYMSPECFLSLGASLFRGALSHAHTFRLEIVLSIRKTYKVTAYI